MNLVVEDLGLIEYQSAWRLQEKYAAEIAGGHRPPTLLLLEHPHVYTFGRRGQAGNLLFNEAQLKERHISVHWVDRGGDVTYHGPGQLVGYPLLPLGRVEGGGRIPAADYVGYIRRLEKMLILTLSGFGIVSGQRPGKTGVWIQADAYSRCANCRPENREKPAKIAAIGVKVDANGISRHGFAVNVDPDMSYWDGIIACGLPNEPLVSMADLLSPVPSMEDVRRKIVSSFEEVFQSSRSLET